MNQILDLLTLPAVQRSAIGLAVAAIGLPIVGVFIIGLDIIAVRFAVMHVALLGIALGLLTGLDPTLCGLLACALAGAGVAPLARRPAGLSGAMGLLMTFAIAGALLVLSASGVNANGAFELLWGSILATRTVDLIILAVLTVAVHVLFWRHRRQLTLLLFDRELALCSGVAAGPLMLALLVVVAVAIGASISLTGALLVDALTILPALAARNLGRSLTSMVALAIGFGVVGNAAGLAAALAFDQPPGPVLVLTAGVLTLLTYLIPEGALDAIIPGRRAGGAGADVVVRDRLHQH
ncbi:metal ABC transporter permease [Couchioplanes caeruleus]|uniref:Zinc transport system permease protein n=1 Tax=Couchioplanes caeruleus TaxID=56438 RepID=A0A3N1GFB4_9ACTN|nr:metal ABC transporter permease [Couchioplanes caeruleus]ROP28895.1 zinc transport system permease protein [Couchioplanes caeruleus]